MQNQNLYVITGGPGSGKTTLLEELGKQGFKFAPEVARQIIQEQMRHGGKALPWEDRELYTKLMLEWSVAAYKAHESITTPMFLDRGIPDTLCYARLIGLHDDKSIRDACKQYRYATQVFIAPPWKEIYKTDSERKQDFEEAIKTYELMAGVYKECGYELIELPKATSKMRAKFILKTLNLKRGKNLTLYRQQRHPCRNQNGRQPAATVHALV